MMTRKSDLMHRIHAKPLWLFKQSSEDPRDKSSTSTSHDTVTEKEKRPLLCKHCRNEITTAEHSSIINGKHAHRFTNPAGITFNIGCFSQAWGCIVYGIPTYEYTWFAGFTWCIALCTNCHTHLGWYYQSGKDFFFGLILDNLIKGFRIH